MFFDSIDLIKKFVFLFVFQLNWHQRGNRDTRLKGHPHKNDMIPLLQFKFTGILFKYLISKF